DAAAPAPKPSAPRKQIAVPGACLVAALTIWAAGLGTESALAQDATQSVAATARGSTSTGEAGHQKNALFASSYFDKYGPSSEGEWIPWIEEHISLMKALTPLGEW